jgi:ApbE superfamily uncharacterized protein (UPF0280 family)
MKEKRIWKKFSYLGANFKISSSGYETICNEIIEQRTHLSSYIKTHSNFIDSMVPLPEGIDADAPDIAKRMHRASLLTGIGPMAAVAGINAQIAAEKGIASGADEAIVENGGDIYIFARDEVILSLHAGSTVFADKLAIRIKPEMTPLSVCSSSSTMGHSKSFGRCDLATVVSVDGALSDAAATLACNLVKEEKDINSALEKITSIKGILGALIIKNDKIGIAGNFPEIIKNTDIHAEDKVTRDNLSLG